MCLPGQSLVEQSFQFVGLR
uniref:Uncharacterized protein n=1 Tax=Rhizophora mucronata TaxID=61149 RepID=A0A2P2Q286_RHIMU